MKGGTVVGLLELLRTRETLLVDICVNFLSRRPEFPEIFLTALKRDTRYYDLGYNFKASKMVPSSTNYGFYFVSASTYNISGSAIFKRNE